MYKLFETGNLYKANNENIFINNKNYIFSKLLKNIINICIDYIKLNMNIDYLHSIYLRGSCANRDLKKHNVYDLDINVVFEDDGLRHELLNQKHKEEIINQMKKKYNFYIYPDIAYFSKPLWVTDPNCYINRFFAKKIYGQEDLSVNKIHLNKLVEFHTEIFDYDFDYFMGINLIKDKSDTLRIIKRFYRSFGIIQLLNNKLYSRDIYYCHNALINNYPKQANSLNEFINIFLNPKDCNNLEFFKPTINSLYEQINENMKV